MLTVTGPTRALLTAERTALNLVGHLSGVATLTRHWVDAVAGHRRVDPRHPQDHAGPARAGEVRRPVRRRASTTGWPWATRPWSRTTTSPRPAGSPRPCDAVRTHAPDVPLEVECDTLDQVREAIDAGVELVLLDNFSLDDTRAAVALARPAGVRLEASGGLDLGRARAVAATGVDYLAVGALTHSAPVLDLGFDLRP